MKKNLLIIVSALALAASSAFIWYSPEKPPSIEGGWEVVWGKYGDNVRDPGKPFQFKMFSDRHFSFIAEDGQGNWNWAAAGTYELEGDIYRETAIYNSIKEYVGLVLEWKYDVRGDTLIMEGPLKVMDTAGNILTQYNDRLNTMREIRVRAK